VDHGLSTSVLEGAMVMTKEFFDMPEEEKQAYAQDYENGLLQGYKSTLDSFRVTQNLGSQLEYILHPESLSIKDNWPSTPAGYKYISSPNLSSVKNSLSLYIYMCVCVCVCVCDFPKSHMSSILKQEFFCCKIYD